MNFAATVKALSLAQLASPRRSHKIGPGKKSILTDRGNSSWVDGDGLWHKGRNERYGPEDIRRLEKERGVSGAYCSAKKRNRKRMSERNAL